MSTLVNAYENLLVDNVGTVRSVESGLRNLTWLLPGLFADADVASEGRESCSCSLYWNGKADCMCSLRIIIGSIIIS